MSDGHFGTVSTNLTKYVSLASIKPVFHFNRIVAKRRVFLCFLTTRVELMTSTQKKMLRYVTIRLKWKTGFTAMCCNAHFVTLGLGIAQASVTPVTVQECLPTNVFPLTVFVLFCHIITILSVKIFLEPLNSLS